MAVSSRVTNPGFSTGIFRTLKEIYVIIYLNIEFCNLTENVSKWKPYRDVRALVWKLRRPNIQKNKFCNETYNSFKITRFRTITVQHRHITICFLYCTEHNRPHASKQACFSVLLISVNRPTDTISEFKFVKLMLKLSLTIWKIFLSNRRLELSRYTSSAKSCPRSLIWN